jgi:hypothetical protein
MDVGPKAPLTHSKIPGLVRHEKIWGLFQITARRRLFEFYLTPNGPDRYDIKLLIRPYKCKDPDRAMDGLSVNLTGDNCILLANDCLPKDEESAWAWALRWVAGYLNWIDKGIPFELPRDKDC